jgi:hypothetical protein
MSLEIVARLVIRAILVARIIELRQIKGYSGAIRLYAPL